MRELLNKIIQPYETIKKLEKEIRTQDTQYSYLQTKYNAKKKEIECLKEENERLEKQNTKHLKTLRERRLKIKELENEITKA